LIVVDTDASRAQALAHALHASGASVVAVTPGDTDLGPAYALDAEIMLVNADEPAGCEPMVYALRSHPRARWTTVLPISFAELWPEGAEQPTLGTIADPVSKLVVSALELAVRVKGKLPYETTLEPLGPNRMLRALGNTDRKLRIWLSYQQTYAELELEDNRLGGVRAWNADSQHALENARALAVVLAMPSAHVRIEERGDARLSDWNVSLTTGLARAVACDPPRPVQLTAPQISRAEIQAAQHDPASPASSGVRPSIKDTAPALPEEAPSMPAQDTEIAARPSARPTRRIALAEVFPEGEAPELGTQTQIAASLGADTGEQSRAQPIPSEAEVDPAPAPSRGKARLGTLVATAVVVVATAASLSNGRWIGSRPEHAVVASRAMPLPRIERPAEAAPAAATPDAVSPAQIAQTARESSPPPAPAAQESVAELPPAPEKRPDDRTLRAQLSQAKRLIARARNDRHARRYERAAAACLKALEISPSSQAALIELVRLHLDERDGPQALRWAQRLVALEPERSSSLLLLGDAYALSGAKAEAKQAWLRASQLGSTTARARLRGR
jgi:tetratricopeptide (TPR) repeat protein